jgi:hypothetical protein
MILNFLTVCVEVLFHIVVEEILNIVRFYRICYQKFNYCVDQQNSLGEVLAACLAKNRPAYAFAQFSHLLLASEWNLLRSVFHVSIKSHLYCLVEAGVVANKDAHC